VFAQLINDVKAVCKLAIYAASALLPRDPNLWVFGAKHAFAGNSHFLFLWVSEHEPQIDAVWITPDVQIAEKIRAAGFRAEVRGTWRGTRALAGAGVYIYNDQVEDVGVALCNGALLVNLWHGSGIKTIAAHNKRSPLYAKKRRRFELVKKARTLGRSLTANLFVSTSPAIAVRFSRAYGVPLESCPIIGTPRLDASVDAAVRSLSKSFGSYGEWQQARETHREIYVYMPTFREGGRDFLSEALPDLERLGDLLAARHAIMFVKLHPRDRSRNLLEIDNMKSGGRVRPWPKEVLFYNVLQDIDCLITDYSSVMFDFIAVKSSGVVIYPFDLDTFISERDLYFPFDESVAGKRVNSFDELCGAIETGAALVPIEARSLARVRARCWEGSISPAAAPVTAEIKSRCGLEGGSSVEPRIQACYLDSHFKAQAGAPEANSQQKSHLIFLAAGMGSRMKELTAEVPKPLMLVLSNRSIMDVNLDGALESRIASSIQVVGGHSWSALQAYLTGCKSEIPVSAILNEEYRSLGPCRSVELALDKVPTAESVIIANGDTLFSRAAFDSLKITEQGIFLLCSPVGHVQADELLIEADPTGVIRKAAKAGMELQDKIISAGMLAARGPHAVNAVKKAVSEVLECERAAGKQLPWHDVVARLAESGAPARLCLVDRSEWYEFDSISCIKKFQEHNRQFLEAI